MPIAQHQLILPVESLQSIKNYKTVAFLVVRNDSIQYEGYWDGHQQTSISNSFSMAKSVISLLVGIAIKEGKIKSIDQKVGDFLPQFKEGKSNQLSIRHLLTMSAGLSWNEGYSGLTSITTQAYYGQSLERVLKKANVVEKPGKRTNYQSGATQILGFILEKATGDSIAKYLSDKLWKPLGAHKKALWSLDTKNGHEKAFCCFNSTARDFARLGLLVLNKGKWKGTQLVPEAYIQEATMPATHLIAETGTQINNYYGLHFWFLEYKGMQIPYMRGILGQYIFIIPQKNAVVVRLGHQRDAENGEYDAPKDIYKYLDIVLNILK
ncbi:beta-lactamase [Microscilla marina ATCC 23134]|uniref:Beta-lactamase n=1 Tax=Microscilla marina ATCC 23134 TaxID=313606 RepID=A1ZUJ8_MICM2|nr:beta-lactamase [Microscilla marina ATCC 23134]